MAIDLGKAKKILDKTFLEDHKNINEDEAQTLIIKSLQKMKDLKEEMSADETLNAAKQAVQDLQSGYRGVIRYEEAKLAYLLSKIEEIQEGVNPHASV